MTKDELMQKLHALGSTREEVVASLEREGCVNKWEYGQERCSTCPIAQYLRKLGFPAAEVITSSSCYLDGSDPDACRLDFPLPVCWAIRYFDAMQDSGFSGQPSGK